MGTICTEFFHGGEDIVGDSGDCALPASVGRADHVCLAVMKQHRHAVGSEDAEQQVRAAGDHRVCLRPRVYGRGDGDDIGAVNLVHGDKGAARQYALARTMAVFHDQVTIIIAAEADIEAAVDTFRNTPCPAQKAVRRSGQQRRCRYIKQGSYGPVRRRLLTGSAELRSSPAPAASVPSGRVRSAASGQAPG